jgi:hypothetical protein
MTHCVQCRTPYSVTNRKYPKVGKPKAVPKVMNRPKFAPKNITIGMQQQLLCCVSGRTERLQGLRIADSGGRMLRLRATRPRHPTAPPAPPDRGGGSDIED